MENGVGPGEIEFHSTEELLGYDADNDREIQEGPISAEIGVGDSKIRCKISAMSRAGKERENEDSYAIAKNDNSLTAAVFDGVSSRVDYPDLGGETGARFASHFLRKVFFEQIGKNTDLKQLMLKLNADLGNVTCDLDAVDQTKASTLPTSTGTFVRIDSNERKIEIAHVADTFCVIFMNDGSVEVLSSDTNLYHMWKRHYDKKPDSKEERVALVTQSFDEKNNPEIGTYGTGAINGSERLDRYIIVDQISSQDVSAILLGSDGLFPPSLSPNNELDQKKALAILRESGLIGLWERNRSEFADPSEKKPWTRPSSPDDSTGIFIELEK